MEPKFAKRITGHGTGPLHTKCTKYEKYMALLKSKIRI
jgi:hypothetical protein